jgi:hypothetical protein
MFAYLSRSFDAPLLGVGLLAHEYAMRNTGCAYNIQHGHATNDGKGSEGAIVYRETKPANDNYAALAAAIVHLPVGQNSFLPGLRRSLQEHGSYCRPDSNKSAQGIDRFLLARERAHEQLCYGSPYFSYFSVGVDEFGRRVDRNSPAAMSRRFSFSWTPEADYQGNPEWWWFYDQPAELEVKDLSVFDKVRKGLTDIETWSFEKINFPIDYDRLNADMSKIGTSISLIFAWVKANDAKPAYAQETAAVSRAKEAWEARYQFLYDKVFAYIAFKICRYFSALQMPLTSLWGNDPISGKEEEAEAQKKYDQDKQDLAAELAASVTRLFTSAATVKAPTGERNVKKLALSHIKDCESVRYTVAYQLSAKRMQLNSVTDLQVYDQPLGIRSSPQRSFNSLQLMGSWDLQDQFKS